MQYGLRHSKFCPFCLDEGTLMHSMPAFKKRRLPGMAPVIAQPPVPGIPPSWSTFVDPLTSGPAAGSEKLGICPLYLFVFVLCVCYVCHVHFICVMCVMCILYVGCVLRVICVVCVLCVFYVCYVCACVVMCMACVPSIIGSFFSFKNDWEAEETR